MNWDDEDSFGLNSKEQLLKLGQKSLSRQHQKKGTTPQSTPAKGIGSSSSTSASSLDFDDEFPISPVPTIVASSTPNKSSTSKSLIPAPNTVPLPSNGSTSAVSPLVDNRKNFLHDDFGFESFVSQPIIPQTVALNTSTSLISYAPSSPVVQNKMVSSSTKPVSLRGSSDNAGPSYSELMKEMAELRKTLANEQNLANELEQQNEENLKTIVRLKQEEKVKLEAVMNNFRIRELELLSSIDSLRAHGDMSGTHSEPFSDTKEYDELKTRFSMLEKDHEALLDSFSRKEPQLKVKQESANPIPRDSVEQNGEQMEIESLKKLTSTLQHQISTISKEKSDSMTKSNKEIEFLKMELQKEQSENDRFRKELKAVYQGNEKLQKDIRSLESQLTERNAQLITQVKSSDTVMSDFHEMASEVKSVKERLNERDNEISKLKFVVEELNLQKSASDYDMQSLRDELERVKIHQSQMVNHESQLIESIQAQLSDALQRADDQNVLIQDLEREKNEISSQSLQFFDQFNALQYQHEEKMRSYELAAINLKNQMALLEEEVKDLNIRCNFEKSEAARLLEQNGSLTDEIKIISSKSKEAHDALENELNEKRSEIESLMNTVAELREKSDVQLNGSALQLSAKVTEAEAELQRVQLENKLLVEKIAKMESDKSSMENRYKMEIQIIGKKSAELQSQLQAHRDEIGKLREAKSKLKSDSHSHDGHGHSHSVKEPKGKAKEDTDKLKERISMLEGQLDHFRAENEKLKFDTNQNAFERYRTTAEILEREKSDLTAQVESQKKLIEKMLEEREDSMELHNLVTTQSQQIQIYGKEKQELQKLLFNKTVELNDQAVALQSLQVRFDTWSKMNALDKLHDQEKTISQLQTVISELRREAFRSQGEQPPSNSYDVDTEPTSSPSRLSSSASGGLPELTSTQTNPLHPNSQQLTRKQEAGWFWKKLGYQ